MTLPTLIVMFALLGGTHGQQAPPPAATAGQALGPHAGLAQLKSVHAQNESHFHTAGRDQGVAAASSVIADLGQNSRDLRSPARFTAFHMRSVSASAV